MNGLLVKNAQPNTVTNPQLGASLRALASLTQAMCSHRRWRPAVGSDSAADWEAAGHDMTARTLTEADVHAIVLLTSGLEHAHAVGQQVTARRVFLPHTQARTATEHLLRAQYLLDGEADRGERVRRRLNEWLYACAESTYRRRGLLNSGLLDGDDATTGDPGGPADLFADVAVRAEQVGESVTTTGKTPRVAGTQGRPSAMQLTETLTTGEGAGGLPSFTMRGHAAISHGVETGLLTLCSDNSPPDPALGGVIVPQPRPMEPSQTAFCLLPVLLTTMNAADAIRLRFAWHTDSPVDHRYENAAAKATSIWRTAVNAEPQPDQWW